jgi:hypothetical protein
MGLPEADDEIAEARRIRPGELPIVVVVDGWASIAFVQLQHLSAGGCS